MGIIGKLAICKKKINDLKKLNKKDLINKKKRYYFPIQYMK